MTKRQFIDMIIYRLAGGNMSSDLLGKYHPEMIAQLASNAMNSVLFDLFRSNESALDLFAKDYVVDVDEDTTLDLYYIDLPTDVVQLPNNAGIRKLSAKQDQTYDIPLVPSGSIATLAGLEVTNHDDRTYAFMTGEKIFFQNKSDDTTEILVKIVRPLAAYSWTDDVYLPAGKGVEIADMVQNMMLNMPPEDVKNDNNDQRP